VQVNKRGYEKIGVLN